MDDNDEQPPNSVSKLVALLIFHFEISGNDINDEHLLNKPDILIT